MLAFKILLVFYIFDTVLMFGFIKTYKAIVTGQFFCKYNSFGSYRVSIHEKSYIYKESSPINVIRVPYGSSFTLKGIVRSFSKPNLLIKVVHDCSPPKHRCYKLFFQEISTNCIRRKGSKKLMKRSYDFGATDLTSRSSIYLACYRKRASI